jgi:YHS domain-containing protein
MAKYTSKTIKKSILVIMAVAILVTWTTFGLAFEKVNQNFFGVAIKGYDTVAYFTEGLAVKGKSKFSHTWNDAKWHFSSGENRDLFAANPERYAPQYGGY